MVDKEMGYSAEQKFVIENFQTAFRKQRNTNIILYGIGLNTEAILNSSKEFNIIGLMDKDNEGKFLFNLPVFSMEEVQVMSPKPIVIIIARQSVIDIIYKRIENLWIRNKIKIYDYQGKDLTVEKQEYRNEELPYWNSTFDSLCNEIDCHDIISFDVFDTLLMRRVLLPTDVYELIELKLKKEQISIPFRKLRIQAENNLSGSYPNLDDIYIEFARLTSNVLSSDDITFIRRLEESTDEELLVKRDIVCEALEYAFQSGKRVFLLSDMYYSKKHLIKLLRSKGIAGFHDIFVSCEIKHSKEDGQLFDWYKIHVGNGKKLHIGDNYRADFFRAKEREIDAFLIYSGYELLMASAMQSILANMTLLSQRCILGLFVADVFNDPFILSNSKGYIPIHDIENMGYGFVAPLLVEFTLWLDRKCTQEKIEKILFPSRDGYLIQKLYRILAKKMLPTVYFRTSRRAVSVAAISNKKDIERISKRKFTGTTDEFLKLRYGISMEQDDERASLPVKQDIANKIINEYENEIILNAREERIRYLQYLRSCGVMGDEKVALFDFVAGGTVQHNLSILLNQKLQGIYMATMNLPNDMFELETSEIWSAFGNITSYGGDSELAKYYLFLEAILVDGQDSFSHVAVDGSLVFEGSGTNLNYVEIKKIQDAVEQYAHDYHLYFQEVPFDEATMKFTDLLFGKLFSEACVVDERLKSFFVNDDIYDGVGKYQLWK